MAPPAKSSRKFHSFQGDERPAKRRKGGDSNRQYYEEEDDEERQDDSKPQRRTHQNQTKERELPAVNEIKNKIRNTKRLLARPVDKLPADARIEQERALKGYEQDLQEALERKKRSAMIKKYHFVRFIERKTATKELNRLQRRRDEISKSDSPNEADLKTIERQIHAARIDLNYTIYCPLTEKYVSLFANEKKEKKSKDKTDEKGHGKEDRRTDEGKGTSKGHTQKQSNNDDKTVRLEDPESAKIIVNDSSEKPPMWHVVERCMKERTLDLLRDGRLGTGMGGQKNTGVTETPAEESSFGLPIHSKSKGKKDKTEKGAEREKHGKKSSSSAPKRARRDDVKDDEDDDDSDGGFFE